MNKMDIVKIFHDNHYLLDANEGKGTKVKMVDKAKCAELIADKFSEVEKEKWDLLAWAILNDYSYDDEGDQWFEVVRLNPYTTEKISKKDMYNKFKQHQSENKND